MVQVTHIDHTAFRTTHMEKTVQFYCGVLELRLLQAMQGGKAGPEVRRYVFAAGGTN